MKNIPQYKVRRGAKFVLGLGTKVVTDKKKKMQREWCRKGEL
jgi:hypothetical protein